jgi:hypothetical protein
MDVKLVCKTAGDALVSMDDEMLLLVKEYFLFIV